VANEHENTKRQSNRHSSGVEYKADDPEHLLTLMKNRHFGAE
jgi:hypothetical protein